jgi:hypothetical protein
VNEEVAGEKGGGMKPRWQVVGLRTWRLTYKGKSLTLRKVGATASVEDPETEAVLEDGLTWKRAKSKAFEILGVPK